MNEFGLTLRFGRHARQRLLERGITQRRAELVVSDPDISYDDPDGNPCRVKTIRSRRIKVVLQARDPGFVRTVNIQ